MPYKTDSTLEEKLSPLRTRYKLAGEMEKGMILKAVEQYKKEYGVSKQTTIFEETFKTAEKIFGKI